jgi:hypothetical protein
MPTCKVLLGLPHDNDDAPASAASSSNSYHNNNDEDDGYWEGVVELNDMAELTFLHSKSFNPSSSSSSGGGLGRGGSMGSSCCHSHGSCGMETIEESSEEDEREDDDESIDNSKDEGNRVMKGAGGSSPPDRCSASSCPNLDATADEGDDEGDDECMAYVDGTAKRFKFLSLALDGCHLSSVLLHDVLYPQNIPWQLVNIVEPHSTITNCVTCQDRRYNSVICRMKPKLKSFVKPHRTAKL